MKHPTSKPKPLPSSQQENSNLSAKPFAGVGHKGNPPKSDRGGNLGKYLHPAKKK